MLDSCDYTLNFDTKHGRWREDPHEVINGKTFRAISVFRVKLNVEFTCQAYCASTLERQRSRFYKALAREKRNFKTKTFTAKIQNFTNFGRREMLQYIRSCVHVSIDEPRGVKKGLYTLFTGS